MALAAWPSQNHSGTGAIGLLNDERIIERSMKHPNWLAVLVVGHVGTTVPEVSVRISEYGCKMVQLYLFCVWVMFHSLVYELETPGR